MTQSHKNNLEIRVENFGVESVKLDGKDLHVTRVTLDMKAGELAKAIIQLVPENIEFGGRIDDGSIHEVIVCPECSYILQKVQFNHRFVYVGCMCELDHEA